MEQLQNIDLILGIVVKILFIIISLRVMFGLYSLLRMFRHIKQKADEVSLNIQSTSEHIKQEVTVENFIASFKDILEKTINIYLINSARKQVFGVIKKFL